MENTTVKSLIGKTIKDVIYEDGYCDIEIIFDDGDKLTVSAEEVFDFIVEINDKNVIAFVYLVDHKLGEYGWKISSWSCIDNVLSLDIVAKTG